MIELEKLQEELQNLLFTNSDSLEEWLQNVQPADLAALLPDFSGNEQERIYNCILDYEQRRELLSFLEGTPLNHLLQTIPPQELAEHINSLPPDEAVDLLGGTPLEIKDAILQHLNPEVLQEVTELSRYEEGCAGSVMTTDFLTLNAHARVRDALNKLREESSEIETIDFGYVLTEGKKILGQFEVKDLLSSQESTFLLKLIDEDIIYVRDTDSTDVVLQLMTRHSLLQIPVIDHSGEMKGIITADDMLEVAKDLMDADFYHMVGTTGDPTDRSIISRSLHRMPWLASTLLGGTLAAVIQMIFKPELEAYGIIVVFIPFVIAMAGNVGVQSATIIVRELVNQETSSTHIRRNISKEILTGFLNATVFSIITFILLTAFSWSLGWNNLALGLSVSIGLFGSICFAALIGSTIPIIFTNFKIDPAISSGPIITVTTDVIGLSIYLLTSTILMRAFGIESLQLPDLAQIFS